ncbi:MAG TPA: PAS domain S-box protein, partial [Cytophaga sp.]|nr:PAS domain S-box protein [Cytophaga sp.]
IDLQSRVGGEIYENSKEVLAQAIKKFILLIIISLAFAIPFAHYLFRNINKLIKDLRETNKIIIESEEKYRTFIQYAGDSIFFLNEAYFITDVNNSGCTMLGYSKEELLKMRILDIMTPEGHEEFPMRVDNIKRNGGSLHERKFKRKDGSLIDTEVNVRVLKGIGYISVIRDITERKKVEARILERESQLTALFDNIEGAASLLNADKKYLLFNRRFIYDHNLLSNEDPYVGREIYDFLPADEKQKRFQMLDNVLKGFKEVQEVSYLRNGKRHFYRTSFNPVIVDKKIIGICSYSIDLTESKESEEKYRYLFQNNPACIIVWDLENMTVMEVNNEVIQKYGYTKEEWVDMSALQYRPAGDWERIKDFAQRMLNGGEPLSTRTTWTHLKKNGEEMQMEISSHKIIYNNRQAILSLARDVTEQVKAEAELRKSEEKFHSLVDNAADAIFMVTNTGIIFDVNHSATEMLYYAKEELIGMSILNFYPPAIREGVAEIWDNVKINTSLIEERTLQRKDSSIIDVEISRKKLPDESGAIAIVRDITERKKIEKEIIKEKHLSDSIINSLPGVFYLYTAEGVFLRWNTNFEKVTLYNSEEIRKMHPLDFFDDDEKELLIKKIGNVFATGEDNVQANFLIKTKEKIPYYFTGVTVEYEGQICLMGVGIDFSERVKAQEEIKLTSEKLKQLTAHLLSVREEERKRIGREIHDELGQQLTAIKMDVAWIDKKTSEDNPVFKTKLRNIITLLDGGNVSIRRILNELRPIILDDYGLLEALKAQGESFTNNTGIHIEFIAPEIPIRIPEEIATCIFRVCQETLTNITRYAKASEVVISLNIEKEVITLTIEDNGIGFDPTTVKHNKSFGILGMKERVLSLKGDFDIVTAPEKGTKVNVSIPLK